MHGSKSRLFGNRLHYHVLCILHILTGVHRLVIMENWLPNTLEKGLLLVKLALSWTAVITIFGMILLLRCGQKNMMVARYGIMAVGGCNSVGGGDFGQGPLFWRV